MTRTRIAPSPTGYPHIGTIYQALFDYSFAKKNKGKFVVRIEDTDRERFVEDAEEKIFDSLEWFGLIEDESPRKSGPFAPYRQSERLTTYQKYAQELIKNNHAYYCFCTKERLEEMRKILQLEKKQLMYDKHCRKFTHDEAKEKVENGEKWVVRLKVPENETISFTDVSRGEISFESSSIDDQVLLKSDGYPTYHLAVVVDDHLMEITHVVRGEEWITSTPKHILLFRFLNWELPVFFHTPVLRNPDKSKLSKRQGHTNVAWYKDEGFLPEVILNFLALMGWSHPEEKEVFPLEEFINLFDLKDVKPVGPIFDLKKLQWLNGLYIREKLEYKDLVERLKVFYKDDKEMLGILQDERELTKQIIEISRTRMKTLKDFKELMSTQIVRTELSSADKEIAKDLTEQLEGISEADWTKDNLLTQLKKLHEDQEISWKTLYLLFTGRPQGLPLADKIAYEGREKTLKQLKSL